jgi:Golgi SNAP receptor complex protein 2
MLGASREQYALHEHTFLQGAEARLDDFLAQGREVLDNLVDQRTVLKGTQRRLRDAANTLGLSRDVIGWIDRRRYVPLSRLTPFPQTNGFEYSAQDMYIFWAGAVFTFFCFYLIWRYLG